MFTLCNTSLAHGTRQVVPLRLYFQSKAIKNFVNCAFQCHVDTESVDLHKQGRPAAMEQSAEATPSLSHVASHIPRATCALLQHHVPYLKVYPRKD